jgi:hypothetical protein
VNSGEIAALVISAVSAETISEDDLNKLEQSIQKLAGGKAVSAHPSSSEASREDKAPALAPSRSEPVMATTNTHNNKGGKSKSVEDLDVMVYEQFGTPREYTTVVFKTAAWDDDWSKISKLKKTEFELHEQKRKAFLTDRRESWKTALDSHVEHKMKEKEEEKVKKGAYKVYIEQKSKEWEQEEKERQEKIRQVNLKLKQERSQQLKELNEAKSRHAAFEKKHDAEMARRIKDSVEEEKRKEENRLIEQKRRLKEFLLQNEVNKVIMEKKKQELMEEDSRLLIEAEDRAIRRERQRAFEEEERQRKMKERVKVVEHSDVMQKAREQEKKDIERMIKIQKEHEISEAAKEAAKKKKRADDNRANTEYLKKQIERRKDEKVKLEAENEKFATLYKEEALKLIEEEKVKADHRKKVAIENRKAISEQIESKVTRKLHPVLLSEVERKLNTDLLKRLENVAAPEGPLKPW